MRSALENSGWFEIQSLPPMKHGLGDTVTRQRGERKHAISSLNTYRLRVSLSPLLVLSSPASSNTSANF
jgi:hypothetical protein